MKLSTFHSNLLRGAAIVTLAMSPVSSVLAQTQAEAKPAATPTTTVTPYSRFQYSTITSTSQEIDAVRVPAIDANGHTHDWDVSLQFDVDAEGNLTLAAGSPIIVASKSFNSANFKAGKYVAPSNMFNGQGVILVAGPTALPGGGSEWSLTLPSGSYVGTAPNSAIWYVESSIANSPLASRIENAKITSTSWSYGVGVSAADPYSPYWAQNSLLGFSQVGNSITIADFTNTNSGIDQSTPVDQITYTLQ